MKVGMADQVDSPAPKAARPQSRPPPKPPAPKAARLFPPPDWSWASVLLESRLSPVCLASESLSSNKTAQYRLFARLFDMKPLCPRIDE